MSGLTRKPWAAPIGALVVLLTTAACAAPAQQQAAPRSTAPSSAPAGVDAQERAAAFTSCMREHGIPDFPGITIGADGQVRLNGGGVDPLSSAYQAAAEACAALLPPGSALPQRPEPSAPTIPAVGFTCTGDCPAPPKTPARPN
ncbi:hypothetical protein [Micromonospora sp. CPCC 206061]|uniref:hypothetical protein n=1 Tax=Micromonospora sp. CPCC 206061 TaxID=3122410 RepID=UPI002FF372F7